MQRRLTVLLVAITLLCAPAGASAATNWKTHQDRNCGIEIKYPEAYVLEASGAPHFCALWMRIGVKEPRGLRALFTLDIRERQSVEPAAPSARDYALHVATLSCMADGPDGSTHCANEEVRSTFKTTQGFRGFEIHMTEIREQFAPKKVEKRRRGPIYALDLSDDQTVRVLMASAEPARLNELKSILDTLRVWTRARRQAPRVVEMQPFRGVPHALALRVISEPDGASRWPPSPVTSWLLTDPKGRRLGRDLTTGAWSSEAPAVTHSAMAESGFVLRESLEGRYELQVTASIPSAPYLVTVVAPDGAGRPVTVRHSGRTAEPGAPDRYELVYSPASTPAVTISEMPDFSRFTILLASRGDVASELIVTDPQGRQTGLDPVAKVEHRKIPRSSYADEGTHRRSMVLDARQPMDGSYTLQVTGGSPGSYSLDLRGWGRSGPAIARPELRDVPTGPGIVHLYRLDYASAAATPLRLGGRFEADRLLAFASPTRDEMNLRAGVTSFPLIIFYGARINPVTFNAMLNGDNVSGRFTPDPEGREIVRIPVAPGLNTLVLSVEGQAATGQITNDTHRLLFRVEQ